MNRGLIDYNPEGQGAVGEALLFGMVPPQPRASSGEVAELEFASAFLDAGNSASLGSLVNRLMTHASLKTGRAMRPDVARALAPRLGQAASIIGRLLRTGDHPGRQRFGGGDIGGRTRLRHRV